MELSNAKMKDYAFLQEMYNDGYFPNHLVDKGRTILVELCQEIETKNPTSLEELYVLTHKATDRFNDLQNDFWENDSEIETVARDCIGVDVHTIAQAYGFENADIEELTATRDW